jgi:hypothetical protein
MPALQNGPPYTDDDRYAYRYPLPLDLTVDGLTAHFSATGQGFSIQTANDGGVLAQPPAGFSGYSVWPNSIFAADLHIAFSQSLL